MPSPLDPTASAAMLAMAALIFAFATLKALFQFLGYLFPELDDVYRKHLDRAVDALDKHSLFDLGQLTLVRVLAPVHSFFQLGRAAYLAVAFICLAQNAVVFTVSASLVVASHFQTMPLGLGAILYSIGEAGAPRFLLMSLLVGLLGTAFDLFSIWVTLTLVRRASEAASKTGITQHLLLDIFVAILSCMWAYGLISLTLQTFYDQIAGQVHYWAGHDAGKYISRTLWESLAANPPIWYIVIGLGISAAFPTIAYLLALTPVLALRLVPRRAQALLSRIVYLLTTDKDPIFKQLSSFSSSAGALIAATATWVKSAP